MGYNDVWKHGLSLLTRQGSAVGHSRADRQLLPFRHVGNSENIMSGRPFYRPDQSAGARMSRGGAQFANHNKESHLTVTL